MSSEDDKRDQLSNLFSAEAEDKSDEALDAAYDNLSTDKASLKRQLLEERFCWIMWSIILLDVIFFDKMSLWAEPVAIVILELVLLMVIAGRLGIKEISILLFRVIDSYAGKKGGG